MDALVEQVVAGLPNIAVALIVLRWCFVRIEARDKLLFDLVRKCFDLQPDSDPEG